MTARRTGPATSGFSPGALVTGMLTKNLLTKLAALVIAVGVWFLVRMDVMEDYTHNGVNLEIRLEPGLVLLGTPPSTITADFTGRVSGINALEQVDEVTLRLVIRKSDLLGQDQATLSFSAERGNLDRFEHSFGKEVRVTGIQPNPLNIEVAQLLERVVPVAEPEIVDLPEEWEATVEMKTPTVRITGPKSKVTKIESLELEPVRAGWLATEKEEEVTEKKLEHRLAASLRDQQIHLVAGQRILCPITYRKSNVSRKLTVPFRILREGASAVKIEPVPEGAIRKIENGKWGIELEFVGTPSVLDLLDRTVEEGRDRVYAWVRAEDFDPFNSGQEGRGAIEPVQVVLPPVLRGRVSFKAPAREDVNVITSK